MSFKNILQIAAKPGKHRGKKHKATSRRGMPYNKSFIDQASSVKIS